MTEAKKGKQGLLKDSILSFSMKKEKKNQQTHKNLTKAKPVQCYWSYPLSGILPCWYFLWY